MIFAKNLPKILWPEAVAYACYIKNRTPTWALGDDITLFQALTGKKPNLAWLEEFGTNCWVMVLDQRRARLDPKAEEHTFVGIAEHAKAWKYYNRASKHVQISRNITFDENDNKLYPIPDNDGDNNNMALLEGEQATHECMQEPIPSTPQTSSHDTTPEPNVQVPTPQI